MRRFPLRVTRRRPGRNLDIGLRMSREARVIAAESEIVLPVIAWWSVSWEEWFSVDDEEDGTFFDFYPGYETTWQLQGDEMDVYALPEWMVSVTFPDETTVSDTTPPAPGSLRISDNPSVPPVQIWNAGLDMVVHIESVSVLTGNTLVSVSAAIDGRELAVLTMTIVAP